MRSHRTHAILITSKTTDLAHLAAEDYKKHHICCPAVFFFFLDHDAVGSAESDAL